ncbi:hypothetical protein NE236_35385 [Actinoallomurus purpureus]|uniref:hypothetical protein n=1 Tax=Actinoallomurus purpureus TaxID=478114 RepID=UPI002092D872|nr:hypothetical protein [Actinoallomurus purpureus]MCO6010261.1 hypothetical protein [Actinoallomurus purpureus]
MTPENLSAAVTFAVVGLVMLFTHTVADHWVQASWQANNKGLQGDEKWTGHLCGPKRELPRWVGRLVGTERELPKKWVGRLACAAHVVSYTFCTALAVGAVWYKYGLHITWTGFILGQVISAVTHYWADRRFTLKGLAKKLGKEGFYALGAPRTGEDKDGRPYDDNPSLGTGSYSLDQSYHMFWIMIAAIVTSLVAI